mgnify:CR=1 FL=1
MKLPKSLVGLLIGGLLGIIFWYWQKSTSAEDGAIDVLDRLAASDARVRDLEARLRNASIGTKIPQNSTKTVDLCAPTTNDGEDTADNLQEIDGIGPTYARRLQDAGIGSFAELAAASPERVMEVSAVRSVETAESWISAAQERLNS